MTPKELPMAEDLVPEDDACGFARDHDQHVAWEDEDTVAFRCEACGAEWWEDKAEEARA